jgi:hypothetical protein
MKFLMIWHWEWKVLPAVNRTVNRTPARIDVKVNYSVISECFMRILHIWDQAGVACIFAKYQCLQGHDSKVITFSGYDKYGIHQFYKDYIVDVMPTDFTKICIQEAEKADIIHIHGKIEMVFRLRRRFGTSKKIILEYLGTDIRGLDTPKEVSTGLSLGSLIVSSFIRKLRGQDLSKDQIHYYAQMLADSVLVSTPDLLTLVYKGEYIPIPVDLQHFKPNELMKEKFRKVLTMNTEAIDIQQAISYCKKNGVNLDIEIYDRIRSPVLYTDMPSFLKKYEVYVDIRFVKETLLANLSSTALQALACGLSVLDFRLKYLKTFPIEHDPMHIVSELFSIYQRKRRVYVKLFQFLYSIQGSIFVKK